MGVVGGGWGGGGGGAARGSTSRPLLKPPCTYRRMIGWALGKARRRDSETQRHGAPGGHRRAARSGAPPRESGGTGVGRGGERGGAPRQDWTSGSESWQPSPAGAGRVMSGPLARGLDSNARILDRSQ